MQKNLGFTLIEMLISLLLSALMVLGFDAMLLTALHESESAYFFSTAQQQIDNLSSALFMIKDKKEYNNELLKQWDRNNQDMLPQGRGKIEGDYPDYQATVFWGEQQDMTCPHIRLGKTGCLFIKIKN